MLPFSPLVSPSSDGRLKRHGSRPWSGRRGEWRNSLGRVIEWGPRYIALSRAWVEVKSDEVLTDWLAFIPPLSEVTSQGEGEAQQPVGLVLSSSSEHAVSTASLLDEVPTQFEVNQSHQSLCFPNCTWYQGQESVSLQRVRTSEAQVSMRQVLRSELDEVPTLVRSEHRLEWACSKCCT